MTLVWMSTTDLAGKRASINDFVGITTKDFKEVVLRLRIRALGPQQLERYSTPACLVTACSGETMVSLSEPWYQHCTGICYCRGLHPLR